MLEQSLLWDHLFSFSEFGILTYKRTHTGDPNAAGMFGINDCMGSVRNLLYDAVIGVGGIGAEPRDYKIDGKITWVGIYPTKRPGDWRRGPLINILIKD